MEKNGERLVTEFESLWRLFLDAATDPQAGPIVYILDALDECRQDDRDKIIGRLQDFYIESTSQSSAGSRLKFLVTSRPYRQIELQFFQLTKHIPTTRLAGEEESNPISGEISLVVKAKVAQLGEEIPLAGSVQSSLERRLLEIPNRTYLWLKLIWEEIRGALTCKEKKLLKLIEQLPETVEQAYEQLLTKCNKKEHARRVLHIILAAHRPLTLSEMDVALEIQVDSKSYEDLELEGDENRKIQIRTLCGLFVSIVDSRIYLIHQTAKEFLIRRNAEELESSGWRHSFDLQTSHNVLAKICITHLCFDEFKGGPLSEVPNYFYGIDYEQKMARFKRARFLKMFSDKHVFLGYSANYWITHFREAGKIAEDDLISLASKLCGIKRTPYPIWFEIFGDSNPDSAYAQDLDRNGQQWLPYGKKEPLPLYWAALHGLEEVVLFLLKNGPDVNAQGGYYGTALQAAAAGGYDKMVQFLVQLDVDVYIQDRHYGTALQAATAGGYDKMVQFLVQSDADVNIQG